MSDRGDFRKLQKSETLVERVIAQIQELIVSGELAPGHLLPVERQLGERLGVSRTVIRESLAALTAKGLIEPCNRGGFVVATPSSRNILPSLTLFLRAGQPHLDYAKVHEVRELLEVEIAGFAAARRVDADITGLEEALTSMRESADPSEVEAFALADVEFHVLLAKAAHNPLLWLLMETVSDVMRDVRLIGSHVPGQASRAIRHHTAILKAVKAGDANKARDTMRGHLAESYATMTRAMKKLGATKGG